jgi:hypothetical protein
MNDLKLVRKYEPVLRFAKGENFFPMDVTEYLPDCVLLRKGDGPIVVPPLVKPKLLPCGNHSRKYYLSYADQREADPQGVADLRVAIEQAEQSKGLEDFCRFLWEELRDLAVKAGIEIAKLYQRIRDPSEEFEQALENYGGIERHAPTYYYRVVEDSGGYKVVQYWFFYAYNDFFTSHNGANDHEADWESIHLFFKGDEPVYSAYARHVSSGKELTHRWDSKEMDFEGEDHPVVYVGAGSHASYYTPKADPPVEGYEAGDVVVGGGGRPWAEPQFLTGPPWFEEFQGRWGSCDAEWYNPVHVLAEKLGGAPAGPKFNRDDGSLREKWGNPARFAGLI